MDRCELGIGEKGTPDQMFDEGACRLLQWLKSECFEERGRQVGHDGRFMHKQTMGIAMIPSRETFAGTGHWPV